MDLKPVEAALTEVGKAFRLSRLYPATHPSVRQALSELAGALPAMATLGALELRIAPTGFVMGAAPVAARNPQIQEFASLLYAQSYRVLVIEPGVTADEFGALARMAASAAGKSAQALGVQGRLQGLPHLKLGLSFRRSAQARGEAATAPEAPVRVERGSVGVFRPDALPPAIEATRLMTLLDVAAPAEAPRHLARLAELAPELEEHRDLGVFARAMGALAAWSRRTGPEEEAAAAAAREGLARSVSKAGLMTLVSRLSEPGAAPPERDAIVQALGALGERAVAPAADAFEAASPEHRELLLAIVRLAGPAAVRVLGARLDADTRGEHARGLALLLGATRLAAAAPPLTVLARNPDAAARAAAVAGLAQLEVPEAGRLVVGALRDRDPAVRIAAAHGIAWFGDASVVPNLLAHLTDEADVDVTCAIVATLGELRDARAVPNLVELARGVSGVFQRRPPAVRAAALRALAHIGTPEARAVVASFRDDRNGEIRRAVDEALGAG